MFRKIFTVTIISILFLCFTPKVSAEEKVDVYFFWGQGCPHCAKEHEFLNKLSSEDSSIIVHEYEVWNSRENFKKFNDVAKKLNAKVNGVPFLAIGDKFIVGYLSDEITGEEIKRLIEECKATSCSSPDSVDTTVDTSQIPPKQSIKVGNFDLTHLSLPALTVALGFLDGFNPCAMWTLLFLISLLIGMEDKKKMWVLGTSFIVASATVYFIFMAAWLNLMLFIGYISWVRLGIGIVAIVAGVLSFKKFTENNSGCSVAGDEKRKNVFEKLGAITTNKSFILALFGIVGLAFAVNLVELLCSAGLPAVYTQILALNSLNTVKYYLYILLYILFFMLDDLFVFFVAMITMQATGLTTKYVKYSRFVGGLIITLIGFAMIFKPELLLFG